MISQNPFVLAVLQLPAWIYRTAVEARLGLYDRWSGLRERAPIPVLSVGNLTVGGTGKTTFVAWLSAWLRERGFRPAILTRGYGGRAGRGPLVVCRGAGPEVPVREAGDEPFLLAQRLPWAVIVAGADRVRSVYQARALGADVAVLDDGFQHLRLERDLDILLLDAQNPFGNYRLLPAGTLREPARGLNRADVIVITRSRAGERFDVLERVIRRYNPRAPVVRAGHRLVGFFDAAGRPQPAPPRAVAFCGIGNPEIFFADLERSGLELAATVRFRDHHPYTARDVERLEALAREHGATLLTTEKDLVRLLAALPPGWSVPLGVARIEAVVHDAEALRAALDCALRGAR